MKEMKTLALRLFIITAFAAFILSLANNFTSPVIADRRAKELEESLRLAYSDADEIVKDEESEVSLLLEKTENSAVKEVFKCSKNGEATGYVYRVVSKGGYGGSIEFIVGIENSGETTGFKVLSSQETPGFGKKAEEEFFEEGVKENNINSGELVAAEIPSTDTDIQGISGATISTNCILTGLNAVANVHKGVVK